MSNEEAVEAALNQYSLLLNGRKVEYWEVQDQDGMREELHALLELMLPHIQENNAGKALRQFATKLDNELTEPDIDPMFHPGLLSAIVGARIEAHRWENGWHS